MMRKQKVCCPNCGHPAERYYFQNNQIIQTACPSCDYLMVSSSLTGHVLESYSPGIAAPCS
jgi:cation transporter-like permease